MNFMKSSGPEIRRKRTLWGRERIQQKATRKLVRTLSAILLVIPCSKRLSVLQMKAIGYCSQPFTKKRFAYTGIQDDHEDDTSSRSRRTRTRWIIRSVLLKAFAQNGAEKISDSNWIHLIEQGSSQKRVECCLDNKKSLCHLRAIQGKYFNRALVKPRARKSRHCQVIS